MICYDGLLYLRGARTLLPSRQTVLSLPFRIKASVIAITPSSPIELSCHCNAVNTGRHGGVKERQHMRKGKGKGKRVRARVRSSTAVAVGTVLLYCTVPRRPTTKHKSTPDIHRPSKHKNNKHITAEAPNGLTVSGAIYPREAAMKLNHRTAPHRTDSKGAKTQAT